MLHPRIYSNRQASMNQNSNTIYSQNTSDSRPLVLVADDDDDNLSLVSYTLHLLNVNHIKVLHSSNLYSLANKYLPDLILLDIVMPEINGIDLAYRLKQNERTSKIPLIAVTGLVQDKYYHLIKKAGFNSYLTKPFLINDLEKIIIRHLSIVC